MSSYRMLYSALAIVTLGAPAVAIAQPLPPASTWVAGGSDSRVISSLVPGYCDQKNVGSPFTSSATAQSVASAVSSECYAGTASAAFSAGAGSGTASVSTVLAAAGANCGPNCYEGARSFASGEGGILDYFLVQSSSLAYATPVTIYFRAVLDVSYAQESANAYILGGAHLVASTTGGALYRDFAPGDAASQGGAFSFLAYVGEQISASLDLRADFSLNVNPDQSGSVDMRSSVQMWLDSGSPDVQLISSSGYDYSSVTATPEPASLLLFGTGLAGVIAVVRRRGSRRR